MILAIDFDNTIHDIKQPLSGRKMGGPMPQALEALETLYDSGHQVIVHTCMATSKGGKQAVEDWLDYYGVEYHSVTATKPQADYYVDDKAITHTDWPTTLLSLGIEDDE